MSKPRITYDKAPFTQFLTSKTEVDIIAKIVDMIDQAISKARKRLFFLANSFSTSALALIISSSVNSLEFMLCSAWYAVGVNLGCLLIIVFLYPADQNRLSNARRCQNADNANRKTCGSDFAIDDSFQEIVGQLDIFNSCTLVPVERIAVVVHKLR